MTLERARRDPEIARAEADIARAREAVTAKLMALQRELTHTFEWREWIRERPMVALAAAFGVGALLGSWRGAFHRNVR